jgi:hypothetical protein
MDGLAGEFEWSYKAYWRSEALLAFGVCILPQELWDGVYCTVQHGTYRISDHFELDYFMDYVWGELLDGE